MTLAFAPNGWFSLSIAIIFGVLGTICMKLSLSHGVKKLKPALYLMFFYTISFIALTFAMQKIELSVVYAVWSGVGTILVAAIGIFYFNETLSARKIIFLTLIVVGVIGMHISDAVT